MQKIDWLVLDMGGVLIHLDWAANVKRLIGQDLTIPEIHRLWVEADCFAGFETGRYDQAGFIAALRAEFDCPLNDDELMSAWLAIVQDQQDGVDALFAAAAERNVPVALFSNSNPAHIAELTPRCPFFGQLTRTFLAAKWV